MKQNLRKLIDEWRKHAGAQRDYANSLVNDLEEHTEVKFWNKQVAKTFEDCANQLEQVLKANEPPEYDERCPVCGQELIAITYPAGSLLNEEQWMSCRNGDYYCQNCPGAPGFNYAYWWKKDLKLK